VTCLIEHSTSHQLLWCIDSFVLKIRHCAKRQNVMREFRVTLRNGTGQSREPSLHFQSKIITTGFKHFSQKIYEFFFHSFLAKYNIYL